MTTNPPASRRITPKLREQAARLCSAYASVCTWPGDAFARDIVASIGVDPAADRMAIKALVASADEYAAMDGDDWIAAEQWALAECLLRTGWVPS